MRRPSSRASTCSTRSTSRPSAAPARKSRKVCCRWHLLYGNLGLPAGFSLEGFYQFKWEETVIDGCGTYFSDLDFVAKGCNHATVPDAQVAPGVFLPDRILQGINSVYKDPFVDKASDSGQFGLALRNYVEAIDTEFGLYYQRLHSRTPVLAINYTLAAASQSILGRNPVPVSLSGPIPGRHRHLGSEFRHQHRGRRRVRRGQLQAGPAGVREQHDHPARRPGHAGNPGGRLPSQPAGVRANGRARLRGIRGIRGESDGRQPGARLGSFRHYPGANHRPVFLGPGPRRRARHVDRRSSLDRRRQSARSRGHALWAKLPVRCAANSPGRTQR